MKMVEEMKQLKKEFVYEQYIRIVRDFKGYDEITRPKMIEEICKVYSDYNNIISICTTRELKYLKLVIDGDNSYRDEKYTWEKENLFRKFIIEYGFNNEAYIFEEIVESVKESFDKVDWSEAKKADKINEFLVGFCKIQGMALLEVLISLGTNVLAIDEKELQNHILENKLLNYYVYIGILNFEELGDNIPTAIYSEYYGILEQILEQRKLQGRATYKLISTDEYTTLFYNDFNINNPTIKKFLEKLKELPFYHLPALTSIREYALLNLDRKDLKDSIRSVPILSDIDLEPFFKLMDLAMDEMPSGVLNGLTPNELKKLKQEEIKIDENKEKNHIRQGNAHLKPKDVKLFYKLYFGLLEFTNHKYKINPSYKIYRKNGIDPYEITEIVDMFWENKELIIMEFCLANPYKFSKEELQIVNGFKKSISGTFVIVKYEEEYTAMMDEEKVYMIKGLNCNIDEIIPYKQLPYMTTTTIMPFKNTLVYASILQSFPINFGIEFKKVVQKEYQTKMKYYHL